VSAATSHPTSGGTSAPPASPIPVEEACPLCGAPMHPEQAWCLSCGAAARTRLAASPSWKGPIGAFAAVLALALGVLAAALVDLAGGSTPVPAITRTVTTAPAAITPSTSTTTAPSSLVPGAGSSTTSTSTTGTAEPRATSTITTPSATPTSRTTVPTAKPAPNVGAKTKNEISKAVREGLRKAGVGKRLPGTAGSG
jgi:hypothetical protein